jgi:uncharacterized membrane protein YeaQ/YmgE (transglycosylase-associated protein family)
MVEILIICLIGAIAGWIACAIIQLETGSIFLDILLGIVGGYLGYRIFGGNINISGNFWVDRVILSSAGAVVVALVIKLLKIIFRQGGRATF